MDHENFSTNIEENISIRPGAVVADEINKIFPVFRHG
jgi:hypothetical protein